MAMPSDWREKHSENSTRVMFERAPRTMSLLATHFEFGHKSSAVMWFDPETLVKGTLENLAEAVKAVRANQFRNIRHHDT